MLPALWLNDEAANSSSVFEPIFSASLGRRKSRIISDIGITCRSHVAIGEPGSHMREATAASDRSSSGVRSEPMPTEYMSG